MQIIKTNLGKIECLYSPKSIEDIAFKIKRFPLKTTDDLLDCFIGEFHQIFIEETTCFTQIFLESSRNVSTSYLFYKASLSQIKKTD